MFTFTPVVKNITIICIIVFIVDRFFPNLFLSQRMALFSIATDMFLPTQLFTYMFAHGDLGHLFFNCMTLVFMGSNVELVWGFKRFLAYYIATGIGAAIIYLLLSYFIDPAGISIMVGASGAIYGILVAFGYLFAEREIQLMFPPIRVKGKYMAIVLGLFAWMVDKSGQVAHFAHLGGGLVGFFMIRFNRF